MGRRAPAARRIGSRHLSGPAGQGKTRLAHRLGEALAAEGWASVALAERATPAEIAVLADAATPTLVVIDYVEGRTDQLTAVVDALAGAPAKTRLLLLARTAGAWRTDRVDPSPHLEPLADDRIVVELGPLEPTPEGRAQAWREAVTALAGPLRDLADHGGVDWPLVAAGLPTPSLIGARYRTILAVHMHALATLLQAGAPIPDAGDRPEQVLLAHESRYWRRVANRFDVGLTAANQRRLVATATLWGAADEPEAHRIVTATGLAPDRNAMTNIADWLAALYRDRRDYWSGVQPDALGEYLVGLAARDAGLVADTAPSVSTRQLERGLTLLGRAHPDHPHLVQVIADTVLARGKEGAAAAIKVAPLLEVPLPLIDALERFISAADLATLGELSDGWPRDSVVLTSPSVLLLDQLLPRLERLSPAELARVFPVLTRRMVDLVVFLALSGLGEQAAGLATQCVSGIRLLARVDRAAYLPDLASALMKASALVAEGGQVEEAVRLGRESVELHRELAAGGEPHQLRDLARALRHLAVLWAAAGRASAGIEAARESVELCRGLVGSDRIGQLPGLVAAEVVLSQVLLEAGHAEEAQALWIESMGLAEEARGSLRESGVVEPAFARLLEEVTHAFQREGRVGVARHNVASYRDLVARHGEVARPGLAEALALLVDALIEQGRLDEAAGTAREAARLVRELPAADRAAQLPRAATLLNALASRFGDDERVEELLAARREAVALYRELAEADPGAHRRSLAITLEHLTRELADHGRVDESLATAREAVRHYRALFEGDADAHRADLARSSVALVALLGRAGDPSACLPVAREAVKLWQELVAVDRDRHLPGLASSTLLLAVTLFATGNRGEAGAFARKAADHYRVLSGTDPATYRPMAREAEKLLGTIRLETALEATSGAPGATRRDVTGGSSGAVSPRLAEFGRTLGDALAAGLGNEHRRLMALLPGTSDVAADERRRYLALDWLVRRWLPAWLDLLSNGRAGANTLRDHPPLVDAGAVERVERLVRAAVRVPGLILSDYVIPSVTLTPEMVAEIVVKAVTEQAVRAAGWDAAHAIAPTDGRCRAVLATAHEAALQVARTMISPVVFQTVRAEAERRSGRPVLFAALRGSPAVDPAAADAGTQVAWTLLGPVTLALQGLALELFQDMISEGNAGQG